MPHCQWELEEGYCTAQWYLSLAVISPLVRSFEPYLIMGYIYFYRIKTCMIANRT